MSVPPGLAGKRRRSPRNFLLTSFLNATSTIRAVQVIRANPVLGAYKLLIVGIVRVKLRMNWMSHLGVMYVAFLRKCREVCAILLYAARPIFTTMTLYVRSLLSNLSVSAHCL